MKQLKHPDEFKNKSSLFEGDRLYNIREKKDGKREGVERGREAVKKERKKEIKLIGTRKAYNSEGVKSEYP